MENKFDKDYYENGIQTGVSGYKNYHYIPTRSIPEAISICAKIPFNSVLEFGAAKGFLVHALSLLGKEARGVDISEYAIANCLPQVKDKLTLIKSENYEDFPDQYFDLIIAKDVLEHIEEDKIPALLNKFYSMCGILFVVVPLGDDNAFRIREYELDKTHVTKKDEEWWINKIKDAGFTLRSFSYDFGNVKEKWTSNLDNKYGNGFFVAQKGW